MGKNSLKNLIWQIEFNDESYDFFQITVFLKDFYEEICKTEL